MSAASNSGSDTGSISDEEVFEVERIIGKQICYGEVRIVDLLSNWNHLMPFLTCYSFAPTLRKRRASYFVFNLNRSWTNSCTHLQKVIWTVSLLLIFCVCVFIKVKYHIKWQNYSDHHNTWEPVDNLSCQKLIDRYEERHADSIDSTEWDPKPKKIWSSQMIDGKVNSWHCFVFHSIFWF